MRRNPRTAAVLSLIIPGMGQFYSSMFWWGLFWLVATPFAWPAIGLPWGLACHGAAAWQAYRYAKKHPY